MPANGAVLGAVMILCAVFAGLIYGHVVEHRRLSCDAHRIEAMGGVAISIPHTCARSNAAYRDRDGSVWEFGRKVKTKDGRWCPAKQT